MKTPYFSGRKGDGGRWERWETKNFFVFFLFLGITFFRYETYAISEGRMAALWWFAY